MGKNIFDMYNELIGASLFDDSYTPPSYDQLSSVYSSDDDEEDFITSKEIVHMKEKRETEGGIELPTGPIEIEEDVHFKRYTKRHEHKYTEKELEDIRASCESSIVHDFGEFDIYHLSDEERAENDSLSELGMKLDKLKKVYRRVDQYIEAMRVVVEAWELLESKDNFLYSKDEFFRLVAEGRIFNSRITTPKLKNFKDYNPELIIRYISNPHLDPKDLVPPDERDKYQMLSDDYDEFEETEEETMERLLSPEEVQYILDNVDNPSEITVKDLGSKYIRGYDRRSFISSGKKKKKSKSEQFHIDVAHKILNTIQDHQIGPRSSTLRSWFSADSMFDTKKKEHDFWDDLYYDGGWTEKNALFVYDLAIREEISNQHPPEDRYRTYGDIELDNFFRTMEQHGMDTIELRRSMGVNSEEQKLIESKKKRRANRKIESRVIQRVAKLNNNPKFKKLISKVEKEVAEQSKYT